VKIISIRYVIPIMFFAIISFLFFYADVRTVSPETVDAGVEVAINFLLPIKHTGSPPRVTVIPEYPSTPVSFSVRQAGPATIVIRMKQEGYPQGQLLKFSVEDVSTVIPLLKKTARGQVRPKVGIKLISQGQIAVIPSRGPVQLQFNTPVEYKTFRKYTVLPVPGKILPLNCSVEGVEFTDYSRWEFFPDKPFVHGEQYKITLGAGIRSLGGSQTDRPVEVSFTAAEPPKVIRTEPAGGEKKVVLYRPVECELDREVESALIRITDPSEDIMVPGRTIVEGKRVVFRPVRAFLPGKTYKVFLAADSKDHEPLGEYSFSFSTVEMGNKYWVDVRLGDIHTVKVYRGDILVRHMVASGGREATPTPIGSFYTQDRGHSFWSPRFGEGATYWVRLVGQVLVHSVPKDDRWKTKEDEHARLGLPASHGCIRLDEKDARWFYENIPMGTLVIIHE